MTATTALTAQNTQGVYDIHQVPPVFLGKQIDACFEDIGVDVVKTGMLASTETIRVVAERLAAFRSHPHPCQNENDDEKKEENGGLRVVLDPVMIATTGAALLPSSALRELRESLFPLATVVTPNVPEARLLLTDARESGMAGMGDGAGGGSSWPVQSVDDLERMARSLLSLGSEAHETKGPQWVVVKGGHTPFRRVDLKLANTREEKEVVVDVLVGRREDGGGETVVRIETQWMESRNTHGTGCSLACESAFHLSFSSVRGMLILIYTLREAAIASNLAKGLDVPQAVRLACRYVRAGIETAPGFGKGSGPLNHFHSTFTLPFSPSV